MPFRMQQYQGAGWLLLLTGAAVLLGSVIALGDFAFSLYVTILLAAFGLSVLLSMFFQHPNVLPKLIFFGLAIRVLIFIFLKWYSYHLGLDGFYPGDVDAYAYHGDAVKAIHSHSWLQALEGNLTYTVFIAFLYHHIGPDMLIPQLVNISASILMIPLLYELGRKVSGNKAGITAAFLWCLFPSGVFWSLSLVKDTFVAFGIVLTAFLILGLNEEKIGKQNLIFGILGISLIALMRPSFLLAVSLTVFTLIVMQFLQGSRHFFRNTLLTLTAAVLIGVTAAGSIVAEELTESTTEEGVDHLNEVALAGGSGIEIVTRFPPEVRWIVQLPFSLFAPFPWQWHSVSQGIYLLSGLEMLVWYFIYYSIWKKRTGVFSNPNGKALFLFAFSIFLAVSFSLPNIGSIYRYRLAALVLLMPLAFFKVSSQKKPGEDRAE